MNINNKPIITTKKLLYVAMLFSLFLLFSFLSKELQLVIFPSVSFLKLEFVSFLYLISYKIVGLWTYFIIVLNCFLRIIYTYDDIISIFSLLLAGLSFLSIYIISEKIILKIKIKKSKILAAVLATIVSGILSSFIMCLSNYYFLLDWYSWYFNVDFSSFKILVIPIFLPFNLISFGLNGFMYLSCYPVLKYINTYY
ncbi:hypothetical protein [Spiroplasma endosymbiont of Amphibalanus improvisus]|uniref:hypothetical protein n=1 Tax=Spiroplasma endosymbiont of Amphibalanus improvisus TaxID=3066327 RepID=UPI00313E8B09